MIFFLIIPLWLIGLAVCALLAFFKPTRLLAIYLSLGGTGAVLLSFVISTLAMMAPAWLGQPLEGAGSAILLVAGYAVGVLGGGAAGAALGVLLAWRLTRKRTLTQAPATLT